ncbi:MAG: hypothetical protein CMJ31_03400 [Phycisphaerae bacterium]|nr:hypothetical protein [Phycisphaerae bacterium]
MDTEASNGRRPAPAGVRDGTTSLRDHRHITPLALVLTLSCGLALPGCSFVPNGDSSGDTDGYAEGPPLESERREQRRPGTRQERADAAMERAAEMRTGSPEAALAEFERAIELNPTMTVAYLGAGDIYRERGDYALAENRYGAAARLEPRNFDAQYNHGLVLQLLDRVTESIRAYLRALSIREDDFNANLNLATAYLQLGEPTQARPFAERAVRLDPNSGPARANLGSVYAALGEHGVAVIEYQQAAERMKLTPELLLNLADALGQTERYEEMAATLDQLIRLEPSAVAYERLGAARFRLRQYDAALEAFQSATELDPSHYPAWNGVGVCLLNRFVWSGKQDRDAQREAVGALRRSLRIEPGQTKIVELVRRYG